MMKDGQEQRMRAAAIAEEEKASSVDASLDNGRKSFNTDPTS